MNPSPALHFPCRALPTSVLATVLATLLAIALATLSASSASAQTVSVRHAGRAAPVDAKLGEEVVLEVALGRRPLPPGATVRWMRIVPHLQHVHGQGASTTDNTYANAVLGGPDHGEWVGVDRIEYRTVPFQNDEWTQLRDQALVLRGAPTVNERAPHRSEPGSGTLWVSAEVRLADGSLLEAPGLARLERIGLRRDVMRVSFREGDDLLGWLSAFFGVPYVFGSTPRQSDRRNASDCADIITSAYRLVLGRDVPYTSVPGLARHADALGEILFLGDDGVVRDGSHAQVSLRWGSDIQGGDLMMIDYSGGIAGRWRHAGALLRDSADGQPGVLDGADMLRHMARRGLSDDRLERHGTIRFRLWRLRSR